MLGSSSFVPSHTNKLFSSNCNNCICVLCGPNIGCHPYRMSLFHTVILTEFYIICTCDVLSLPMMSLTVVLRVLEQIIFSLLINASANAIAQSTLNSDYKPNMSYTKDGLKPYTLNGYFLNFLLCCTFNSEL